MMEHALQEVLDTEPWYKQFWPWFIIALPATVVVAGISTVFIAFNYADSPVTDHYYKKGLAINKVVGAVNTAKELKLSVDMAISNETLSLQLNSAQAEPAQQLIIELHHPADQVRDRKITLLYAGNGAYRGAFPSIDNGKWYIDIYPNVKTESLETVWLIKGEAQFPTNKISLKPK